MLFTDPAGQKYPKRVLEIQESNERQFIANGSSAFNSRKDERAIEKAVLPKLDLGPPAQDGEQMHLPIMVWHAGRRDEALSHYRAKHDQEPKTELEIGFVAPEAVNR